MTAPIHSKIVKIGNSQGIRIPRTFLDQADLSGEVLISIENNKLIVESVKGPRKDWAKKFAEMADRGDDKLLDQFSPSRWDEDEWEWE